MRKIFFSISVVAIVAYGLASCGKKSNQIKPEENIPPTEETMVNDSIDSADTNADSLKTLEDSSKLAADTIAVTPEPMTPQEATQSNEFKTTKSGLKYRVIREGNGRSPKPTDVVLVNYEGKLLDGTIFDSSYLRGQPISFPLNQVIPGWIEGLQLMQEGAEYEFMIPYQLAYGAAGAGPIPPKSDLYFRVELIQVQ